METRKLYKEKKIIATNTPETGEDWYSFSKVDSEADSKRKDLIQLVSIIGIIILVVLMIMSQTFDTLQAYIVSM